MPALSPAALSDLLEDVPLATLVPADARDPDAARSDAALEFLTAAATYDPALGEFRARARALARYRSMRRVRQEAARRALLARYAAERPSAYVRPARFEIGAWTARLGPDARAAVAALFDGPRELDAEIYADPDPGPASVRRHLATFLRDQYGWSEARVREAFKEISQNLSF